MNQGFSLIEVLLSLFLVTSISLALLKQQWHVHQLFHQMHVQANIALQLDNTLERHMAFSPLGVE